MSRASDAWYVHLPDGRVLRANSTEAVCHHLRSGRIPLDSRVRRSADEEWGTLEWTQEFTEVYTQVLHAHEQHARAEAQAGLPRPANLAARLDPLQLRTVGIRGAVEELLAALDSTMVRLKLRVAVVIALLLGIVFAAAQLLLTDVDAEPAWWSWPLPGSIAVVLVSLCQTLLTKITYAELATLRPARWQDGVTGLVGTFVHVVLGNLLLFGSLVGALVLLRQGTEQFPEWYRARYALDYLAIWRDIVGVAAFLAEVLLWPMFGFGLLLAPILVVEDGSFLAALWQWLRLLGRHLGEVFLYQAVALSMGIMVALPLGLTLALAAWGAAGHGAVDRMVFALFCILGGVALTPLLAYLIVANLFVYLHARYDQAPRRK